MHKTTLTLIVLIFISGCSFAQDFTRYTTKNGLPSNHVYDILQDKEGFIWFSTNRGIVKFDGAGFRTFTIKEGLPNNDIWMIATNATGKIWFNCKSKYLGYIENDSVHKFVTEDSTVLSSSIFHISNRNVWYGDYYLKENKIRRGRAAEHQQLIKSQFEAIGVDADFAKIIWIPETDQMILLEDSSISIYNKDLTLFHVFNEEPHTTEVGDIVIHGMLPNSVYYFAFNKGMRFINYKTKKSCFFRYAHLLSGPGFASVRLNILENEFQVSIPHHLIKFR